jgi:addiction module HigA family antidote
MRIMAKLLDEIHPGEILLEDFMKPIGISARRLAADIDVSPSRISELVNGQRPITADTALRLGLFFGMEPRFWLNLQSEYDIRVADRRLRAKLSPRIRVFQPAGAKAASSTCAVRASAASAASISGTTTTRRASSAARPT